ncbi:12406_t:CDS:2 [Ambispora gerdemannii]|uniref:Translation initiation factor eIF2B subunit alpha n=1 Tax=Ambispora gerdemannii TaxID=144530 RepID=A0A9N8ZGC1_9GLOM|nr:12406_t:CDS:2 [Ambispora gerdemannii]
MEAQSEITSVSNGDNVDSEFDIVKCYRKFLRDNEDMSMPIAAIESLIELIKQSKATTISEFMESLKNASQTLKSSTRNSISLSAGTDLFLRFVTRTSHDVTNLDACKEHLMNSGKVLVEKAAAVRHKIAELGVQFIKDDAVILIHAYSRVVTLLLQRAAKYNKRFKVYVTESRPTSLGVRSSKILRKAGIPATVILDTAVGYIIDKVDAVFVGAEGVVENGGLINAIGTYQIAIVAKTANKPFYAVIESYKFVRLFPLNQYDLPTHTPDLLTFPDLSSSTQNDDSESIPSSPLTCHEHKHRKDSDGSSGGYPDLDKAANIESAQDFESNNPTVDYTPPQYITLLCTDLGVLTPSGVSDELIKLYL